LRNNIFGVDVDPQAVEVTKLSLLLKVLEGESEQTLNTTLRLFQERALPDLGENIKCGNSLIGPDFDDKRQISLLDQDEERSRINAFEWESEFRDIVGSGGFDAVIGNPPYIDIKTLPDTDVEYIFRKYPSSNNRINSFAAFIEKSLQLVRSTRFRFSMIVPAALLTQDSYSDLRRYIVQKFRICTVVRLPNESFGAAAGDVKVDTVIVVLSEKTHHESSITVVSYAGYDRITRIDPATAKIAGQIPLKSWATTKDCIWALNITEAEQGILQKCTSNTVPLEDCVEFSLGITPYDKYRGHSVAQIASQAFHASVKKNKTFRKLLAGNDVGRYWVRWNGELWISYGPWLGAAREQRFFLEKRILVKQIIDWTSRRLWATICDEELYNTQNAFNLLPKKGWTLEYILGILNSRLMNFYHRKVFLDEFKMRFQKVLIKDCRRFPILCTNGSGPSVRAHHDHIVGLVQQMLALNKRVINAKTDQEGVVLKRQIEVTDRQIDRVVYELYGLTEQEILVVEKNT